MSTKIWMHVIKLLPVKYHINSHTLNNTEDNMNNSYFSRYNVTHRETACECHYSLATTTRMYLTLCSSFNNITQLGVTDCYLKHVRIMCMVSKLRIDVNLKLINSVISWIYRYMCAWSLQQKKDEVREGRRGSRERPWRSSVVPMPWETFVSSAWK